MSAHVIERVVRRNSSPDGHVIRSVTTGPSIVLNGSGMAAASDAETFGALTTRALTPANLRVQDELYDARSSPGFVDNATTDNTTAFAAGMAIVAAAAGASTTAQKAGMKIPHGHVYRGIIDVPFLCLLDAKGSLIRSPASGTDPVVTLAAGAELRNASVWGSGAGFGQVGVQVAGVRAKIHDVNFEVFGGSAIVVDAGSVDIARCIAQGCLADADTLLTPTGVLHITANGNDAWVDKSEFNAMQVSAMSASGFARAVAVFGGSAQFDTVIGAFADHGWHLAGPHALLDGTRGEFNRGHGYIMVAGSSGRAIGPWSHQNGLQTTNTYDGFNVENNAAWRVTAPKVTRNTGNVMRYGIYDASNGYANFSQYDSTGHIDPSAVGTAPIFVEDFAGSKVTIADGPFVSAAAAATTIDVQQWGWPSSRWRLVSVAPVNFTDFTNHVTGMRISVIGDGFTTFVHNASVLRMRAGINQLTVANRIYEFVNNSGVWYEASPDAPPAWELFGEYTTAGTTGSIVLPTDTVAALVHVIGGGAGGGSGRRGAAASVRCGGGGGAGGGQYSFELRGTVLTETLSVTVGAGGAGGAAVAADDTSGNVGTAGGNSSITGGVSGQLGFCYGGFTAGGGGTAAAGTAGVGIISDGPAPGGGAASGTGAAGAGATSLGRGPTGGGAGGGITSGDAASAGGGGGTAFVLNAGAAGGAIATVGGTQNGALPTTQQKRNHISGGPGGGGGGSSIVGVAGTGGAGAVPGGGGGGGGASLNGNNSGAGGLGGVGYIAIWILRS